MDLTHPLRRALSILWRGQRCSPLNGEPFPPCQTGGSESKIRREGSRPVAACLRRKPVGDLLEALGFELKLKEITMKMSLILRGVLLRLLLACLATFIACTSTADPIFSGKDQGDTSDGDATDGDTTDGDADAETEPEVEEETPVCTGACDAQSDPSWCLDVLTLCTCSEAGFWQAWDCPSTVSDCSSEIMTEQCVAETATCDCVPRYFCEPTLCTGGVPCMPLSLYGLGQDLCIPDDSALLPVCDPPGEFCGADGTGICIDSATSEPRCFELCEVVDTCPVGKCMPELDSLGQATGGHCDDGGGR